MKYNRISKSLCTLLAAAMLIPSFSSCSFKKPDKYKTDNLEDGVYMVSEDIGCTYPYDNKIYVAKAGCEVGFYDTGFKTYTKLRDSLGEEMYRICVNDSGIFAVNCNTVFHMDFDGAIKKTYTLPPLEGECYYNFISVSEKYIAVASSREIKDASGKKSCSLVFMSADLSGGDDAELKVIGEKYEDESYIRSFIPGESTDEFYVLTELNILKLNVKSGSCQLYISNTNHYSAIDMLPGEDFLHVVFEPNYESYTRCFAEMNTDGGGMNITRSIPYSRIYSDLSRVVKRVSDREINSLDFLTMQNCMSYTGHDYIMLDIVNGAVYVYSPYVNETGETLNIIGHATEYDENGDIAKRGSGTNEILNAKFEDETNIRVNYKKYAFDEFGTKLRLEMMSGSSDYDIVTLGSAPDFLASILKYNLYLPLEGYTDITNGFKKYIDGVQDVMTYDGHIYGIPSRLTSYALTAYGNALTLDPDYTNDEFWSLLEDGVKVAGAFPCMNESKYPARLFVEYMKSVIEDGVERGEITRESVTESLELLHTYYKGKQIESETVGKVEGFIYINEGIGGVMHSDSTFLFNTSETDRNAAKYKSPTTLRHMPSYNNKNYIDVDSMLYINSTTKIPDVAAKYLSCLVSDDFIGITSRYEKSFLVKDTFMDLYGSYHEPPSVNVPRDNPLEFGYRKKIYPLAYGMSAYDTFLVKNGADLFTNAHPRLYSYNLEEILLEVYAGLYEYDPKEGPTLTLDEAAEIILKEAKYQFME